MAWCILVPKVANWPSWKKIIPITKWGDIYITYETIASKDEQLFTFSIPFEHESHGLILEKYDILHNMHSRQNLPTFTNAIESMKQPFILSTSAYYDIRKKNLM